MSAPAIKPSMPGVGNPPTSTGHNMLPMNMVAQKVVGSQDSGMKQMPVPNMNYATLQPPAQNVGLNRPPTFQNPFGNSIVEQHKEQEQDSNKMVLNGTEQSKVEKTKEDLAVSSSASVTPAISASAVTAPATTIPTASMTNLVPNTTPLPSLTSSVNTAALHVSPVKQQVDPVKVNNVPVEPLAADKPQVAEVTQKPKEESPQQKLETPAVPAKVEERKVEDKKQEASPQKAPAVPSKVEDSPQKQESPVPKVSTKASPAKSVESTEKPEIKETPKTPARPAKRKAKEPKEEKEKSLEPTTPRSKRNRTQTTPYQSPLPEMSAIIKTSSKPSPRASKVSDDKLIVFYKNEFLAVRNTEGSFYVCQAMQNIYKTSKRINIRWLSQDKSNGEVYSPDFYDHTDFDCILTNLNLNKLEKNKYQLTKQELLRTENILKRAMDVEAGRSEKPSVTEEHPDGLDLSLYNDEAQLSKKKKRGSSTKKRRSRKKSGKDSSDESEDDDDDDDEADSDSEDESEKNLRIASKKVMSVSAIAKPSPPKGPSRAERAAARSKVATHLEPVASSSSAGARKRVVEPKKAPETKKVPTVAAAVPSTSSGTTTTQSRATKSRGPVQETQNSAGGSRPKRTVNPLSTTISNIEESSGRKKARGRL